MEISCKANCDSDPLRGFPSSQRLCYNIEIQCIPAVLPKLPTRLHTCIAGYTNTHTARTPTHKPTSPPTPTASPTPKPNLTPLQRSRPRPNPRSLPRPLPRPRPRPHPSPSARNISHRYRYRCYSVFGGCGRKYRDRRVRTDAGKAEEAGCVGGG